MIIIPNPFWIALEVINITMFLLLWRIISMGCYGPRLEQIKEKAETLLLAFSDIIGRLWFRITKKRLSQRGQLVMIILLLIISQLVLYSILGLL